MSKSILFTITFNGRIIAVPIGPLAFARGAAIPSYLHAILANKLFMVTRGGSSCDGMTGTRKEGNYFAKSH